MDRLDATPDPLPPEPSAPPSTPPRQETHSGATGTTAISDAAVAKVAAAAARTVDGVFSLGIGSHRALGALRGAVGATAETAHGVTAEVGTAEAAIDVVLTATYGRPLHAIAADVRAAVFRAVESLTGFRVIEVNVEIGDVHLPGLPPAAPAPPPTEPR
ncbi:Asp23/Gls24 family envelope stress response protein [Arthrobacter sp. KK5.5]|uniref:Asp23/Gls24 family envelope stress response protein n=1 Tax=Arthrobacter sp. KK5.5 TaxID=3373084 RepID=UPI003EE5F5D7